MMSRLEKVTTHTSTAIVALSGIVYGCMKYLMATDDPFAVVNHPLQPWMLDLHVLSAPVMLFALGLIAQQHILAQLARGAGRPGRTTGLIAISCLLPMVATGYLIQVFTHETARLICVVVHIGTGVIYTMMFLAHTVISRRLTARRSAAGPVLEADDSGAPRLLQRSRAAGRRRAGGAA
ncbi:MAG: hypothetical protein ACREAA_20125 [Candidatus Polarisedimenticolia bacterium]